MTITVEDVKRSPTSVMFIDHGSPRRGTKVITATDYPRLVKIIDSDGARYEVDGWPVAGDLAEAVRLLNRPPAPTPQEQVDAELARCRQKGPPAAEEVVKELEREIKERERVYLKKVEARSMSPKLMARRIYIMEYLKGLAQAETAKGDLFGGQNADADLPVHPGRQGGGL